MAFFITMFSFEFINERLWLNDFRVFYDACNALLADQQVYGKNFGLDTGFYKYAPSTLILFVPLAYLPYSLALSIYFFLLSFAVVLLLKSITQFWFKKEKNQQLKFWFSIFLMLSVAVHLIRELHLGNTNLLLLLLCFYAFNFSIKKPLCFHKEVCFSKNFSKGFLSYSFDTFWQMENVIFECSVYTGINAVGLFD